MQETWKNLEQVQELDLQIHQIMKKKADQPARLQGFENEIKLKTQVVEEKRKALGEFERSKRQQMGALELNEERTKRSEEKLELIKNTQEFSSLQREIESLKKNSDIIRENAKKVDEDITRFTTEISGLETELQNIQVKLDEENAKIKAEDADLNSGLVGLEGRRKEASTFVDKKVLHLYDQIRKNRAGVGIAFAGEGRCQACNMKLPPQLYNELQKPMTEIKQCPSCKRILIFKTKNSA